MDIPKEHYHYLGAVLAGIPAAYLYNNIVKTRLERHVFGVIVNTVIYFTFLGTNGLGHLLVTPLYTWYMAKERWGPWLSFSVLYIHLAYIQWKLESLATATCMMMTLRMVTFIWYYHDAYKRVGRERITTHCSKEPSIIQVYGYAFGIGGFFSGPIIPFENYMALKMPPINQKNLVEPLTNTFKDVIMCVIVHIVTAQYSYDLVTTLEWKNYGMMYKLALLPVMGLHGRVKYYFIWRLAETVCLCAGWNPDDANNINIREIEGSESMYIIVKNWNRSTSAYLKTYVYKRLRSETSKRATLFTFLLSAFWHGVDLGYYMAFASVALQLITARQIRRTFKPLVEAKNSVALQVTYNVGGLVLTHVIVSYMMAPFALLNWEESIQFYKDMYFIGHIMCLAVIASTSRKTLSKLMTTPTRPIQTQPSSSVT